ncbi:hypothetical protein [Rhodococcoides kyotonense]|uniref:Uncharacterized protein n=1 Tax=Rhodococcoides kyotonense TaxID=398843 RepID=A0A239KI54_9NOCA|nr:hypothetical protein [Rhodococcus kyotonensis]SNT17289.1 hypothetical protein SAMN05421642_110162 [Rhodococcus kyotonensis]
MLVGRRIHLALTAVAAAASLALLAPGMASAQPVPGSADITTGSAEGAVNSGSAFLDAGSSILDGDIRGGARQIFDEGISIFNSLPGSGSAAPRQFCNNATIAGGPGITQTNHDLGRSGPLSFGISWETYDIPDVIDVFYQGALVFTTGSIGDNINEGTGGTVINLPPGTDTSVLVKVTGPGGTDWDYNVGCPFA